MDRYCVTPSLPPPLCTVRNKVRARQLPICRQGKGCAFVPRLRLGGQLEFKMKQLWRLLQWCFVGVYGMFCFLRLLSDLRRNVGVRIIATMGQRRVCYCCCCCFSCRCCWLTRRDATTCSSRLGQIRQSLCTTYSRYICATWTQCLKHAALNL